LILQENRLRYNPQQTWRSSSFVYAFVYEN